MVRKPKHWVHTGPLSIPQAEFEPYSAHSHEEWLNRLLERVSVRSVTAVHHFCAAEWQMAERRMADDMFFYITKGHGLARIEGREVPLLPGVCAHFPRGVLHEASHDPRRPIHVISVHYTATAFESLAVAELLQFPDAFQLKGDAKVDAMFYEACREYALRPTGWERGLEALVHRLLLHLIREHGDQMKMEARESRMADLRRLLPALEWMRRNLGQPIFIPHLAKLASLSEPQFRRVFQRTMNASPVQYLRRIRMEHACQLLRQTNDTVELIASKVGYAETAFFAHSFKKLIGLSPGKYRSSHEL